MGTRSTVVLSQRGLRPIVARCSGYEFEDAVVQLEGARLAAPRFNRWGGGLDRWSRAVARRSTVLDRARLGTAVEPIGTTDLLVASFQFPEDRLALASMGSWRPRVGTAVAVIEELWADTLARRPALTKLFARFDHVFTNCAHSVERLSEVTGVPCSYLAPGVDALRFFPFASEPSRPIDVTSIGRRSGATHAALLGAAEQGKIFYYFDTIEPRRVWSPAEHRIRLAELAGRSKYWLVNEAKFDDHEATGGQQEIGFRFFEGAAGGAVLLGHAPESEVFESLFGWPDSVIEMPPGDPSILDLLAELDTQRHRIATARHANVVNTLRRHDWSHRWCQILDTLGMDRPGTIDERQDQLDQTQMVADLWLESELAAESSLSS